ncbi:MAG: hypothetical protein WEA24_04295 [Gemmatimonadota bacterium]
MLLTAVAASTGRASPLAAQTKLGDDVACAACSIELVPLATLGRLEDEATLRWTSPIVPRPGGGFVAGMLYDPGTLAAYDAAGRLVRVFSREGDGPGELRTPGLFLHMAFVGDTPNALTRLRRTLFAGDDFAYVGSRPIIGSLHDASVLRDGAAVLAPQTPDHVLVVDPIGDLVRRAQVEPPGSGAFVVAPGRRGFWLVGRKGDLREYSADGAPIRRLMATLDRVQAAVAAESDGQAYLNTIWEDDAGRLWTVILLWQPAAAERYDDLRQRNMNEVYPAVLRVYDLETGHLLAERHLERWARFTGRDGTLHTTREDASGLIKAEMWRVELRGEPSRSTSR